MLHDVDSDQKGMDYNLYSELRQKFKSAKNKNIIDLVQEHEKESE